jgi:hypothetical protein
MMEVFQDSTPGSHPALRSNDLQLDPKALGKISQLFVKTDKHPHGPDYHVGLHNPFGLDFAPLTAQSCNRYLRPFG